ncbi:MAG: hypothetical protein UZ08_BCD001001880 [Candidatus Parvibacillus calidus]|jgi:hypothetical protein|nr:MAG: hypothetical protein UZ08_BCD001001880 [Candidatus Parvibacillus calidus]
MELTFIDFQTIILSINRNSSLYSSGKIYVVIIVITVVLCGFFLYLFNLDKKLKSLENKIKSNE